MSREILLKGVHVSQRLERRSCLRPRIPRFNMKARAGGMVCACTGEKGRRRGREQVLAGEQRGAERGKS